MALGDLIDPPVFNDNEVFIRKFKEGTTKVRFLPSEGKKYKGRDLVTVYGTEAWPSELEHYNPNIEGGYVPCVTPHGMACGACTDPDKRVKKRSRSWYANALDVDANIRVYRMGVTLHDLLQARESRHPSGPAGQPLSKRDYLIHHIGTGLDSKYDPEADPDGLYDIDFTEIHGHDIAAILENLAERARLFYSSHRAVEPEYQDRTDVTEPATGLGVSQRITPKGETAVTADAEEVATNLDVFGQWGNNPSSEVIQDADTQAIRVWLSTQKVDYPARANRALLVKLALAHAERPDE